MDEKFECLRCHSICLNPVNNICPYCGREALIPLGGEYFITEDDEIYEEPNS